MPIPKLLPTTASHEAFAGVAYQVDGELVPALHVQLADVPVYFEHHVLLWKEPRVEIGLKSLKGAFKRILSGMPIFMTEAQGPGHISFSRDMPSTVRQRDSRFDPVRRWSQSRRRI